jgi:glyoxylase I family protein
MGHPADEPTGIGRALHHLAIGSGDVERLAAFYRDLVGLRELARHHGTDGNLRSIWLDLGGAILMIERTDKPARTVHGIDTGPFLLAFRVSAAERQGIEEALEASGHRIESRSPFTSYARDVDGNRVAFSHYPEPSSASSEHDAST